VARAVLVIGSVLTSVGTVGALIVAAAGVDALLALLPPLDVDADAVRGATVAIAFGLGAAAALHLGVLAALRRRPRRRPISAAILLASLLAATLTALAAAAFTSAATEASARTLLIAGGAAAVVGATGYGAAAARLVSELRDLERGQAPI
jgi:hypothetical protein